MVFKKESKIVNDYVLLINNGMKTMADVPNLFNLREVVQSCLAE